MDRSSTPDPQSSLRLHTGGRNPGEASLGLMKLTPGRSRGSLKPSSRLALGGAALAFLLAACTPALRLATPAEIKQAANPSPSAGSRGNPGIITSSPAPGASPSPATRL